jgi:cytochrome c biogenesis protein
VEANPSSAGPTSKALRSQSWSRTLNLVNPLRAVWWLFTNVRFAILLLALLAAISLVGVLVPQMPVTVRGDQGLEQNWLDTQHGRFGFLTSPMHDAGLFEVFQQRWFGLLLAATVVSSGAYVISRFPGIWASISRPRKRVPDRYFEMAPARYQADEALNVERLEGVLRARRYKVYRTDEAGATYLFADRFQLAQLGTLLTHIAVIVFILSAVVQRVDAYDSPLFLAEGSTLPVFAVSNPNQMQVTLDNAYAKFAPDGQPLDYRADLIIYDRGTEVKRCSSTVNTPCTYNGYHFYQEAYFGYGATLSVRDTSTGNIVYRETMALADKSPSPRVKVTGDDGSVLLQGAVVLPESVNTGDAAYRAGIARLPGDRTLTFWQPDNASDSAKLVVFEPGSGDAARATLSAGQTVQSGGLTISYEGLEDVPSIVDDAVPLPASAGGGTGSALFELSNVAFGTARTSAGDYSDEGAATGDPTLTIVGLQPQATTLKPGEATTIDGLEYKFERQAEFAGIDVRRDRSDSLVWIGAFAIVVGLAITFWVPRRRLWAKITSARTALAGQSPSHANYSRELRDMARAAGANIPEEVDDDE